MLKLEQYLSMITRASFSTIKSPIGFLGRAWNSTGLSLHIMHFRKKQQGCWIMNALVKWIVSVSGITAWNQIWSETIQSCLSFCWFTFSVAILMKLLMDLNQFLDSSSWNQHELSKLASPPSYPYWSERRFSSEFDSILTTFFFSLLPNNTLDCHECV